MNRPAAPLFGATTKARWTFALSAFILLIFSEAWMKPFSGGVEGADNGLIRALYYPAYMAGLVLFAFSWRDALTAILRTPLLWVLVGFAFVSAWWSIDPATTQRRAVALLFCTLCGVMVASRISWTELTRLLAFSFGLICVGSFLTAAFAPSFGRMHVEFPGAWSGLFIEKNGLGAASAQTIVFCAAAFLLDRPRRWWWAAGSLLGAALLALSTSKTSLVVGFIGCLAFAFAWAVRRGPIAAVIATFFGVVGVGLLVFAVVFSPETLLGLLGKDATLTGRTRIWAAVMRQVATRPHTGFGYGAVWTDQSGWGPVFWVVKQYGARPTYAHNGWVDLWLGMGDYAVWAAAIMLAVTWVVTIATTYRRSDAYVALPFVVTFTLSNLTETSIAFYNSIGWVLFSLIAAKLMTPDLPRPRVAEPATTEPQLRPAFASAAPA